MTRLGSKQMEVQKQQQQQQPQEDSLIYNWLDICHIHEGQEEQDFYHKQKLLFDSSTTMILDQYLAYENNNSAPQSQAKLKRRQLEKERQFEGKFPARRRRRANCDFYCYESVGSARKRSLRSSGSTSSQASSSTPSSSSTSGLSSNSTTTTDTQMRISCKDNSTITTLQNTRNNHNSDRANDELERVFYNLILKERAERARQFNDKTMTQSEEGPQVLSGARRESLLWWMLEVCKQQECQDEIFPLASMLLDLFIAISSIFINDSSSSMSEQEESVKQEPFESKIHRQLVNCDFYCYESVGLSTSQRSNSSGLPSSLGLEANFLNQVDLNHEESSASVLSISSSSSSSSNNNNNNNAIAIDEQRDQQWRDSKSPLECQSMANRKELEQRQLCLFASCSLLLATKLRQTPRLCVQTLIEFSRLELPLELSREEILDGELLMLTALKWDLAALVAPNDFLDLLLRKCSHILALFLTTTRQQQQHQDNDRDDKSSNNNNDMINRCDHDDDHQESQVRRLTQTLLELCLMDSHISKHSPSILAMASMAVAIDRLGLMEHLNSWRLQEIVTQIHESTNQVNELKQMIEVAFQIEKYVQIKLLHSTLDD